MFWLMEVSIIVLIPEVVPAGIVLAHWVEARIVNTGDRLLAVLFSVLQSSWIDLRELLLLMNLATEKQ